MRIEEMLGLIHIKGKDEQVVVTLSIKDTLALINDAIHDELIDVLTVAPRYLRSHIEYRIKELEEVVK